MKFRLHKIFPKKATVAMVSAFASLLITHSAFAVDMTQTPLFLSRTAQPIVMLSMSVDHELFKKAYNDYSNLDGNSLTMADTTYRNDFEYYGYFDSNWCYSYRNANTNNPARFRPAWQSNNYECASTGDLYTNGGWSGNFLNWATMTRVDVLRQVLYGGKRVKDTSTRTILERSYLPRDIHAFVKVFESSDMGKYTPFTENSISMCNVSDMSGGNDYPVMRIAKGRWRQWSASESVQCQWGASSGPDYSRHIATPQVRVQVCDATRDGLTNDRCRRYTDSNFKPVGVLQKYGDSGNIRFGLATGSYKANLKGGVLRKEAKLFANNEDSSKDEVDLSDGTFRNIDGIVKNLDAMRIAGYSYSRNGYEDCDTHSIPISTVKNNSRGTNRTCSDWGNPLAELYLETLRYMTGETTPTSIFNVDDSTADSNNDYPGIAGLSRAGNSWEDPVKGDEWCTNCSVILLSTGSNSFDGDNLGGASSLDGIGGGGEPSLDDFTDKVGEEEFGTFKGNYFDGATGHCTVKEVNGLSDIKGICPELPALEGTYAVAGLAYYANTKDVRSDRVNAQRIKTYAVDLAESLPSFSVPVGSGVVNFLPACEAQPWNGNYQSCSLIDVQIENITYSGGKPVAGSYLFYWEDSLWGNDYDIDGAQRIKFCVGSACNDSNVGAGEIRIDNSVPYAIAGNSLRFSYTVTGTKEDGLNSTWANRPGGWNFDALKFPPDPVPHTVTSTSKVFEAGSTAATLLKKPLYYAAKYGGFEDEDGDGTPRNAEGDSREWDIQNNLTGQAGADGVPDNYFSVSNPALLEAGLENVFASIAGDVASGSAASANSTRLTSGTVVYQAKFNSNDWTGELVASTLSVTDGSVESELWSTSNDSVAINPATRKIFTHNGSNGVLFHESDWNQLSNAQRAALNGSGSDNVGKARMRWVRGEDITGLRERERWLGDIVNSDPVFAGDKRFAFQYLPDSLGGNTYLDYYNGTGAYTSAKKNRRKVVYVSSNDGMLHAFDADTGRELWAYIPSMVYEDLHDLTEVNYGNGLNPHRYVVDGKVFVGDVYMNGEWRNILVGTLGAGGRGLFALDVTDPDAVTKDNLVLFEFTGADLPALGNVIGSPVIAPMEGGWKLILGNGYNSDSAEAQLLVLDMEDPTNYGGNADPSEIISVGTSGVSDGLAQPALFTDSVGMVIGGYAGDLSGRMWKFDLKGDRAGQWGVDYLLFTARDDNDTPQPITASPVLGLNSAVDDAIMVYFGTGSYFRTIDNTITARLESFYGLADAGSAITASGSTRDSALAEKVIAVEADGVRSVTGEWTTAGGETKSAVDWSTKEGWYLDFISPGGSPAGERVISKPLLVFDRLLFPTVIPSDKGCEFGGSGWIMELVAAGDRYVNHSVLGASGSEREDAVLALSSMIRSGEITYIPDVNIRGELTMQRGELPAGTFGRMSWRQLQ